MTSEQKLIKNLRQELSLQSKHRQLLEAQGSALEACDRERFAAMQAAHADLLARLQALGQERMEMMCDEDGNACPLSTLLEHVSSRGRKTLEGLRATLGAVLAGNRDLSARNQKLIDNELKYIAFMLDLFVEAGRSAEAGYGAGSGIGRRLLLDRRA